MAAAVPLRRRAHRSGEADHRARLGLRRAGRGRRRARRRRVRRPAQPARAAGGRLRHHLGPGARGRRQRRARPGSGRPRTARPRQRAAHGDRPGGRAVRRPAADRVPDRGGRRGARVAGRGVRARRARAGPPDSFAVRRGGDDTPAAGPLRRTAAPGPDAAAAVDHHQRRSRLVRRECRQLDVRALRDASAARRPGRLRPAARLPRRRLGRVVVRGAEGGGPARLLVVDAVLAELRRRGDAAARRRPAVAAAGGCRAGVPDGDRADLERLLAVQPPALHPGAAARQGADQPPGAGLGTDAPGRAGRRSGRGALGPACRLGAGRGRPGLQRRSRVVQLSPAAFRRTEELAAAGA